MGVITTGKFTGTDSSFKRRKPKSPGSSLNLGSARKDSLEKKAIEDKQADEKAKAKEISRREKERKAMRTDLTKRVSSEETDPNRNTDARRRVVNVGRPDTAKSPMDTRSKLAKQGEIKTKIIEDQEKSMTMQKYHNLPDDLVAAVRSVLEGKNPFANKDDDKKSAKKDDDKDDSDDKDTKSKKSDDDDDDKEAKSSKKSDDGDDADKPVGKDGKKTKVDIAPNMKTANEELKGGQKKLDKNHNGKLDKQDFKMLRKEEFELTNEFLESLSLEEAVDLLTEISMGKAIKAYGSTGTSGDYMSDKEMDQQHRLRQHIQRKWGDKADAHAYAHWQANFTGRGHPRPGKDTLANRAKHGPLTKAGKVSKVDTGKMKRDIKGRLATKEEVEQIDELSNKTLRSYAVKADTHLMDIKPAWIRPADYHHGAAVGAHGKTAQKRAQGGELASKKIKQNIAKTNATTKEEVSLSDEETARILAKLNEADDDEDKHDGPEHIVMQLRKAKSLGAANRPIHFHDGSKVKVSSAHVQKALDMHGSFKKAPDKDEFTKKLQASHASFKSALGEK